MTPRIQKLVESFEQLSIDAMLVTDEINVSYLSGFTGDSSYLFIRPQGTTILSDGRYRTQIADECPGLEAIIRFPGGKMIESVRSVIGDCDAVEIGLEADHVSVSLMESFKEHCPDANWRSTSGVVEKLRMIKDSEEIETLRRSVEINERAFQSVLAKLGPDWSERQIAHELEATIRCIGAAGFSFEPIVGAGPAGALPHYRPENTRIGDHSTLLIDWGTFYRGYASDLTRTMHRSDASEKFCSAYQAVLDSQLAAIEKIRPGAKASDVDAAARDVLKQAGLGDYFVHGLGHGIGLQIHESPRMSAIATETLEPGMVITVEPGVYFEGDFGIRIEDDVLVTETGNEVLSRLAKGLDDCRLIL